MTISYKIPIRNIKKEVVGWSLVDQDVYDELIKYNWSISKKYVRTDKLGYMHRYIMKATNNNALTVDHKNNDRLDNRKANLYFATKSEQSQNRKKKEGTTSQYLGVTWEPKMKKWKANSSGNDIGYWLNEVHAAWAYDNYVKQHFTFPKINNLEKPEDFIEWVPTKTYLKFTGVSQSKCGRWTAVVGSVYLGRFSSEQ